ncbi:MAG TPA: chemotaxis response regulator protein-glutamate methylesterase [Xanthobacteraceae bacterium]
MAIAKLHERSAPPSADNPVRVMVVDDSAVIRGIIAQTLEASGQVKVVGSASNGADAVAMVTRFDVEVLILDIEMPVLDGLAALPKLLQAAPDVKIIMASSLTLNGAEISLKALRLGATDYIPKPTVGTLYSAAEFKREIVAKVLGLCRSHRTKPRPADANGRPAPVTAPPVSLRKPSMVPPRVLGIGSSTGGPQALITLLSSLPASVTLPIVLVQHMPPVFTRHLADQLGRVAKRPAQEAVDGMPIERGKLYVAPGGFHMIAEQRERGPVLRVNQEPPENFCRPAVDPMFRSLAAVYGKATLAAVLTGMGSDGTHGAQAIAAAGGTVLAQDEASSVVWGMPGAAAAAGVCSALIPIKDFGARIAELATG